MHSAPEHPHTASLRTRPRVGLFTYDVRDDAWWWSDDVYRLHGFQPHDVVPTTALVLAHKHPDDRDASRLLLQDAVVTGAPVASVHRIMDATGRARVVAFLGQSRTGDTGAPTLTGYFLDLTDEVGERSRDEANRDIAASAAHRAQIEQAKGIVAFAYGVDAESAFGVLRAASNNGNVPIRELASQVVARVRSFRGDPYRVCEYLAEAAGLPLPR
ncbi:PAS and ANTAR domain-containing protein [Cellulomonas shaoxiangyii]|uniref:PAS and ANTAR domain-containing protein n=1 Tax=Cellulomonas shaoxiangyii TaxID=2566013 RepID=UPI001409B46A|nr:PAS and ANTAR domain-containing protein [Cellulomonas shaoxiangyii]